MALTKEEREKKRKQQQEAYYSLSSEVFRMKLNF